MFVPNRELGSFLIDARLISRAELARIEEELSGEGSNLYSILLSRNAVPEDELRRAAAHVLGVPFVELRHEDALPEALMLVPEPLARERSLVVYRIDGHHASALLLDLDDLSHLSYLEQEKHLHVQPHLTDRASIKRALLLQQRHLKDKYAERLKSPSSEVALDALLSHARLSRASALYIEESGGDLRVRYRIGEVVHEAMRLPGQARSLISKLKELGRLSFTLHAPQEGRFKIILKSGEALRVGVFTLRSQAGESMLLTLVPEEGGKKGFALESLGLHGESLHAVYQALHARSGLVLIAGPKGSGKTTTLYTMLDTLSAAHTYVVSVEEKIELALPHVTQVEVKNELGLTTASTLRSVLKHNPDVVMINEIKDEETATLAASAASRGVLVLAGIKAPSAAKAIQKMLSLDVSPLVLAATLRTVVGTRIVERLCQHCKASYKATRANISPLEGNANLGRVLAALKVEGVLDSSMQWKDIDFYEAKGCAECDSGYEGSTGVFEVLPVSAITRELIKEDKKESVEKVAAEVPLNLIEDGLFKAASGLTTLEGVAEIAGE